MRRDALQQAAPYHGARCSVDDDLDFERHRAGLWKYGTVRRLTIANRIRIPHQPRGKNVQLADGIGPQQNGSPHAGLLAEHYLEEVSIVAVMQLRRV